MTTTLVLTQSIFNELSTAASGDLESGGVLLARCVVTPQNDVRLLCHSMCWVPDAAYRVRSSHELVVDSEGFVPPLSVAETKGLMAIWFHTHPSGSSPKPSSLDDAVDVQLADLFRFRSGSPWYGSLILSCSDRSSEFSGYIESMDSRRAIDRLWVVGERFSLIHNLDIDTRFGGEMYSRNILAFGGGIQDSLSKMDVAVVGCGGTGSAIIEQLVRLGVGRLRVFDPDNLTSSNLTRVYGSKLSDINRAKVDIMASHATRIAPHIELEAVPSSILKEDIAKRLVGADVIFGCTDDNASRLVLSRIATYFMTPVIDCGVLLPGTDTDQLVGIYGRVTTLIPGSGCLVCRGRIDIQRAAAETMAPAEYRSRVVEGYVPTLGGTDPAVITYTTQVATIAVGELLERLVGYGPSPSPNEIILRIHDREISTNRMEPRGGHYCDPVHGKIGRGMTEPFLDQVWQH